MDQKVSKSTTKYHKVEKRTKKIQYQKVSKKLKSDLVHKLQNSRIYVNIER